MLQRTAFELLSWILPCLAILVEKLHEFNVADAESTSPSNHLQTFTGWNFERFPLNY